MVDIASFTRNIKTACFFILFFTLSVFSAYAQGEQKNGFFPGVKVPNTLIEDSEIQVFEPYSQKIKTTFYFVSPDSSRVEADISDSRHSGNEKFVILSSHQKNYYQLYNYNAQNNNPNIKPLFLLTESTPLGSYLDLEYKIQKSIKDFNFTASPVSTEVLNSSSCSVTTFSSPQKGKIKIWIDSSNNAMLQAQLSFPDEGGNLKNMTYRFSNFKTINNSLIPSQLDVYNNSTRVLTSTQTNLQADKSIPEAMFDINRDPKSTTMTALEAVEKKSPKPEKTAPIYHAGAKTAFPGKTPVDYKNPQKEPQGQPKHKHNYYMLIFFAATVFAVLLIILYKYKSKTKNQKR